MWFCIRLVRATASRDGHNTKEKQKEFVPSGAITYDGRDTSSENEVTLPKHSSIPISVIVGIHLHVSILPRA